MKKMKFIDKLLAMLLALVFTGCLSDGDETVSLEYGNPKKIIVGTWKVVKCIPGNGYIKPGTILVFHYDGTFTSSSDDRIHRWLLGGHRDDEPYYGGITFDDVDYDIISLGGSDCDDDEGHWVLGKPDKGGDDYDEYFELDKEPYSDKTPLPGGDDDDDNDDPNFGEPSGGFGKLVSKISIAWAKNASDVLQTMKFYYDNTNRVTSVECSGRENLVYGLTNGIRLYYDITDNTMRLYYSTPTLTTAQKMQGDGTGSGYGYATVNDMGYLVYDRLNNTNKELNSENCSYGEFFYWPNGDDKGQTMGLNGADYLWENGDVCWGDFGPNGALERYFYTTTENKANIDFNKLFTHTYRYALDSKTVYRGVYGLALSGYLGNKDKHLLHTVGGGSSAKFSYEFDHEGYPTKIIYNGSTDYICTIEYSLSVLPKY